jgi:hypothetical protein
MHHMRISTNEVSSVVLSPKSWKSGKKKNVIKVKEPKEVQNSWAGRTFLNLQINLARYLVFFAAGAVGDHIGLSSRLLKTKKILKCDS